jgi:hypothetical protein
MGGILIGGCRPIYRLGTMDYAMIEMLFIYQLVRNPLQAIARRWYCRSLYRASRGRRRCPECTKIVNYVNS